MMFPTLDPLLHSELRLAVVSLLIGMEEAEFPYIKEQTGATAGNLSVQIEKLSEAGYIEVEKSFKGKRPCTLCRITPEGRKAFEDYVKSLKSYLKVKPTASPR
jgi:DNA-binding MarR family transcriptional regulator